MEKTKIASLFADAGTLDGQTVTVMGWARTIRDLKTFGFVELNDGSCFKNLQVVLAADTLENYKEIAGQNVGAALRVTGTIVLTPEAKQPLELKAASVTVEGASAPEYPLQKKRHSVDYLRTIAHLRPRTNLFSAAFRVRSAAAYAIHNFFQSRGFVYVHTPIITASDCEGAGEMFRVSTLDPQNPPLTEDGQVDYSQDFFGKPANLTVSGQLNAENFAMAFGDVYTFGPTFRAENSNTQRHAAEFWMIEPEMAFADLGDDMDVAEAMIKHIINCVMEKCPDEMAFFNSFVDKGLKERLEHVASSDFGRVSYTEAVEILKANNDKFDYKVEWGCDLQTEHERYLTEQVYKRPVFVTDYPKEIKAFYMRLNDDGKTVATYLDWELYRLQNRYLTYQLEVGKRVIAALQAGRTMEDITSLTTRRTQYFDIIDALLEATGKRVDRESDTLQFLTQYGTMISPHQLSSGEKQILIILTTVLIQSGRDFILIMDEPEISLHFDWQRRLIDDVRTLNPNLQLILATHSPALVMNGWTDRVTEISDIVHPMAK